MRQIVGHGFECINPYFKTIKHVFFVDFTLPGNNHKSTSKKTFFLYFQNFSFLIGFIHPKPCPTICLMSYLHDYIHKKYVKCTPFAYQGI